MSKIGPFWVSYDPRADVLYINLRREEAARGLEDERGNVWRYGDDGKVIGITLLDFRYLSLPQKAALADEISLRFHVPHEQVSEAIELGSREAA